MKNLLCLLIAIAICSMASSASSQSTAQKGGHFAHAHCRITGADGNGQGATEAAALKAAVAQCIANGGVPACCRKGAHLTSQ
jgi:hypothetical protein